MGPDISRENYLLTGKRKRWWKNIFLLCFTRTPVKLRSADVFI
jgi:hypothetical protein